MLLDPEDGGIIILLRQVACYQLKQCYIPEDLNQEFQIFPFAFNYRLRLIHARYCTHY